MTKLPETISKRVSVFSGKEECDALRHGRCVGGTTAIAMGLLSEAQMRGASFGFDFDNYDTSKTEKGAANLLSQLKELVGMLGFEGFSFKIVSLHDTRGYRGLGHYLLYNDYSHLNPERSFGVAVWFHPIVEVHYDLRK